MKKLINKYQTPTGPITSQPVYTNKVRQRPDGSYYYIDEYNNQWPMFEIGDNRYATYNTEGNIKSIFNLNPAAVEAVKPSWAYGNLNGYQGYKKDLAKTTVKDLDRNFADMFTFGYGTAAQQAAKDWKNGKYLNSILGFGSPMFWGSGPLGNVYRTAFGTYHLANEEGVPKTYREFMAGNYGNAAKSLAGDAFNALIATHGVKGLYGDALWGMSDYGTNAMRNFARPRIVANAIAGDVRETGRPLISLERAAMADANNVRNELGRKPYESEAAYRGTQGTNNTRTIVTENASNAEGVSGAPENNPYKLSDPSKTKEFFNQLQRMDAVAFMTGDKPAMGFFPSSWTKAHRQFPEESVQIINNSIKPRILAQAEKDIRSVYDPSIDGNDIEAYVAEELKWLEKELDEKISSGYELGSEGLFQAYDAPKKDFVTGGLQFMDRNGTIYLREGKDASWVLPHEWRHRSTNKTAGGAYYGKEKKLLKAGYTKEFDNLANIVEDFKGMDMDAERVTTNGDVRAELIGKTHAKKTSWQLQNKIIDKKTDEEVFAAVEKANGYGREYIKYMRKLGKLTPELAKNLREAMKYVGMYGIPATIAGGTAYSLSNNDEVQ